MDSRTLEELAGHFDTKLAGLATVLELQKALEDNECQHHLVILESELEDLGMTVALMKTELARQREKMRAVEEVKLTILQFSEQVNYSRNHLPPRLPKSVQVVTSKAEPSEPVTVPQSVNQDTVGPTKVKNNKQKKVSSSNDAYIPTMDYLTVEEFDAVPKYMKGRIAYNQVNAAVDELNKAFKSKYKLLALKKTTLSDAKRKLYEGFKMQESKDTKGVNFIVEADIKVFASLKIDGVARSIFTILRHVGRMREVRGGGVTRFACVECY